MHWYMSVSINTKKRSDIVNQAPTMCILLVLRCSWYAFIFYSKLVYIYQYSSSVPCGYSPYTINFSDYIIGKVVSRMNFIQTTCSFCSSRLEPIYFSFPLNLDKRATIASESHINQSPSSCNIGKDPLISDVFSKSAFSISDPFSTTPTYSSTLIRLARMRMKSVLMSPRRV